MEEIIKLQNALDSENEHKDRATTSLSKTEIIRKRNQAVKNAMAQELSTQGVPEAVIKRVLHVEEGQ